MRRRKVYVVRHGQDEDNRDGLLNGHRNRPLTPLGKQQAEQAAHKLQGKALHVILCAPLRRTYETATIIQRVVDLSLEVFATPILIERDFGTLSGTPIADLDRHNLERLQTDRINYVLNFPGGEDFPSCYARAEHAWQFINANYPEGDLVIVTSGDIGKMLRAAYHGWTWQEGLAQPYIDNCDILELTSDPE